jgi:hypothetical protein
VAQLGPSAWFREMVAIGGKADMVPTADAVIASVEKQVSVRGDRLPLLGVVSIAGSVPRRAGVGGPCQPFPWTNVEAQNFSLPVTHGLRHNPPVQLRSMSCA